MQKQSRRSYGYDIPTASSQTKIAPIPVSSIETFMSGMVPMGNTGNILTQFGYGLFNQAPSLFLQTKEVPVGPDYVLGPGDEVKINVWGRVDGQWQVVVDRDGSISLPKIGNINVAGLSFKEAKDTIYKAFSQYYTGFEMNVTLGELRTFRVYVVGHARQPGAYTVSSLSTLVGALFQSGGPSKSGTLRNIVVRRNGQVVSNFDFYDLLLKGDKSKDIRLMPEDVIFIAPIGNLVGVTGSVQSPGIYELKNTLNVAQVITMAGGYSDLAFQNRIQIERILDNAYQTSMEINAAEADTVQVQGGDILHVYPIVENKQSVSVSGAVLRDGPFGLTEGMTLRDLVALAGGLRSYAYPERAELARQTLTQNGPVTERLEVNLADVENGVGTANLVLQDGDVLTVRPIPKWRAVRQVMISGEVLFPGQYVIAEGETLASLIQRAGGFTREAFLKGAVFTRESARVRQQMILNEMVRRLESQVIGSEVAKTAISADDVAIQDAEFQKKANLIASLKNIEASGRVQLELSDLKKFERSPYNIELEDGDSLFVPQDPQTVQVVGSVFNQSTFIFSSGKSCGYYVERSGGLTDLADVGHVYILRANGAAVRTSLGGFGALSLESGDTLVVPQMLDKVSWMKEIKDITQILYQVAITTAVVLNLR